jgi:mevalonate pyrophosphate decarboxylase
MRKLLLAQTTLGDKMKTATKHKHWTAAASAASAAAAAAYAAACTLLTKR